MLKFKHIIFLALLINQSYNSSAVSIYRNFNFAKSAENSADFSSAGNEQMPDTIEKAVNHAHSLATLVAKEQRLMDKLDSSNLMEYPVGIVSDGNDLNYAIILDKDEITPDGSLLTAYMSFKVPQSTDSLAFIARDIKLSSKGGIEGEVKLELMNSAYINISKSVRVKILGGPGNSYVLFDCNGFKNMTISAEVQFASNVFVCENPVTGDILENKLLTATFKTTINNWNDLLVEFSLSPFQLKGIKGFGFEINKLVLDFSDFSNPLGITFPSDYTTKHFTDGNLNLWRGIYVKEAIVRLPAELKRNSQNEKGEQTSARVSIGGYNLIIDNAGFTGTIEGKNILTQEEGDMNGWPFTVESIRVGIEANNLVEAGFGGRLYVPLLDSALLYDAVIGLNGDYSFSVTTTKKNCFNVWAADLELYPGSSIEIASKDGVFKPKAKLSGKLTINASLSKETKDNDKNKNISLADITFENLQLQTEKPYIVSGSFAFGSEKASQSMANFPVQITKLGATLSDERAALLIGVKLGVTSESEGGISVAGSANIIGERKIVGNKTIWKYKTVELSELEINANCGPVKVNGKLNFFKEDATYGDGFQGKVKAEFGMGIQAQAMALFGKVNNFRYWFADAMVSFSAGLPVFSGFGIYGFGGGVYSHMKQQGMIETNSEIGKTFSKIVYIPDKATFIGLKATVAIGTYPKPEPFNGDVGYEIAFNNSMGVRYMTFTGNGYFMTPPSTVNTDALSKGVKSIADGGKGAGESDKGSPKGAISASVYINFDFENKVLHGNLKVYVNVAGVIRGVNANNLAGEAVLHFEEKEWYVYVGTPQTPVGITMLNILKTKSYFMLGTKILPSPGPPKNVTDILGDKYSSYMNNLTSFSSGKGIAFGSSLSINTGDVTFLIFYARMEAGIGFDVALINYGNATCSGSSSPLGINGWYANGQAYAYMEGKIGIRVKLFTIEKRATILEGGVAAILQAKMPNPLWMQGAVGGYFNVLGGLVKGKFKFEFTFGEDCKIVGGSALSNIGVIGDITPSENSSDVSVFNAPQAVFNYQINKSFELVDLDNIKKTYRVKLNEFSLYDGTSKVDVREEWNSDNNVLVLKPVDLLPGEKNLKLKVLVSFEQYKNGRWEQVKDNGTQVTESRESEFQTGVAPDYIPLENVKYSYPIVNQMNYYKNESSSGYVQLKQGQDELFVAPEGFEQKGRFVSVKTGKKYYFTFSYNTTTNEVSFTRPSGLKNDEIMRMELLNMPSAQAKAIDANVNDVVNKVDNLTGENDVDVKTKDAEGELTDLKEKIILSSNFRVSSYNTFAEKLSASKNIKGVGSPLLANVEEVFINLSVTETFDKFELNGNEEFPSLIKYTANLTNNNWYLENMYLSVYKKHPLTSLLTLTGTYGIPPVSAMYVYQYNDNKILGEEEVSSGVANRISKYTSVMYNLPYEMNKDLSDLKNRIVNSYWNSMTSDMIYLLNSRPKLLYKGYYNYNADYYLPGKTNYNSRTPMSYRFLLD
jgi:hypothetical protein